MKTAGDLITAIAKFTASVQDGHNNFNGRFADLMHFNRNPAPIIDNGDAVIFSDFNKDMVTVTGQGLIDRVIDDFINQMMEPTGTDTADIHAWPFANGFEALQDLDLLCPIFTVDGDFLFYRFLIVFSVMETSQIVFLLTIHERLARNTGKDDLIARNNAARRRIGIGQIKDLGRTQLRFQKQPIKIRPLVANIKDADDFAIFYNVVVSQMQVHRSDGSFLFDDGVDSFI